MLERRIDTRRLDRARGHATCGVHLRCEHQLGGDVQKLGESTWICTSGGTANSALSSRNVSGPSGVRVVRIVSTIWGGSAMLGSTRLSSVTVVAPAGPRKYAMTPARSVLGVTYGYPPELPREPRREPGGESWHGLGSGRKRSDRDRVEPLEHIGVARRIEELGDQLRASGSARARRHRARAV